eukprot:TRINITY_DN27254_c0_g1_i1.p1 TRINITY_DN27254_c0_g1~~TRINITY_DN27254_c0_g1_i1.p1  ORF type:complete len:283 (+),score=43.45 TRINITY_DN27254_c0_g1_i1:465-1313(+)
MNYNANDGRNMEPQVGQRVNAQGEAMPYDRMEEGRDGYEPDGRPAYAAEPYGAQGGRPGGPGFEPILTDEPKKRRGTSCGRICCILLIVLVVIILLLGIVALVLYLVFQPKNPVVTVTNASVNSVGITPDPLNITAVELINDLATDGAFRLLTNASYVLEVQNPNKVKLLLDPTAFNVTYRNTSITNSTLPAFSVDAGGTTNVTSTILIDTPMSSVLANDVVNDFLANALTIVTNIVAHAKISILGIASPTVKVYLTCTTKIEIRPTPKTLSNTCAVKKFGF